MRVYDKLNEIINNLRNIRDSQDEIECDENNSCICLQFDLIIDELESLKDKFGKS